MRNYKGGRDILRLSGRIHFILFSSYVMAYGIKRIPVQGERDINLGEERR